MVETSNDRNGVVVNRARRSSLKSTCGKLNKRHGEVSGKGEVQIAVPKPRQKVSTSATTSVVLLPEQEFELYGGSKQAQPSQHIGLQLTESRPKGDQHCADSANNKCQLYERDLTVR